jgi:hypothetical protein
MGRSLYRQSLQTVIEKLDDTVLDVLGDVGDVTSNCDLQDIDKLNRAATLDKVLERNKRLVTEPVLQSEVELILAEMAKKYGIKAVEARKLAAAPYHMIRQMLDTLDITSVETAPIFSIPGLAKLKSGISSMERILGHKKKLRDVRTIYYRQSGESED